MKTKAKVTSCHTYCNMHLSFRGVNMTKIKLNQF